jgi:hypothetical protein
MSIGYPVDINLGLENYHHKATKHPTLKPVPACKQLLTTHTSKVCCVYRSRVSHDPQPTLQSTAVGPDVGYMELQTRSKEILQVYSQPNFFGPPRYQKNRAITSNT